MYGDVAFGFALGWCCGSVFVLILMGVLLLAF